MLTPFRRSASLCTATLLWISALVPGCASRRAESPPVQTLDLGSRHSPYRNYKGYNLCAQNSAQLVAELDQVNAVLSDFLQSTSAGPEGVWAAEHLALLADGQKSLPPALGALQETYRRLRQCRLDPASGLPEIVRQGDELARQSGARLDDAPELLAVGEARRAIAQWEESLPTLREKSRRVGCKKRPGGAKKPVAFFATESSEGTRSWYFCDGTWVRGKTGAPAEAIRPKGKAPPKGKDGSTPYLETAARFPPDQISRSPRLPERSAPPKPAEDDFRLDDDSVIDK